MLFHWGSNNSAYSPDAVSALLTNEFLWLIGEHRKVNPNVAILLAQIIPRTEGGFSVLNDSIPAFAARHSTSRSPIIVVDQAEGFVWPDDTRNIQYQPGSWDKVHPSDVGYRKMADKWYDGLKRLFATDWDPFAESPTRAMGITRNTVGKSRSLDVRKGMLYLHGVETPAMLSLYSVAGRLLKRTEVHSSNPIALKSLYYASLPGSVVCELRDNKGTYARALAFIDL